MFIVSLFLYANVGVPGTKVLGESSFGSETYNKLSNPTHIYVPSPYSFGDPRLVGYHNTAYGAQTSHNFGNQAEAIAVSSYPYHQGYSGSSGATTVPYARHTTSVGQNISAGHVRGQATAAYHVRGQATAASHISGQATAADHVRGQTSAAGHIRGPGNQHYAVYSTGDQSKSKGTSVYPVYSTHATSNLR